MKPIRVLSYLAPSIPEEFFELLVGRIASRVGVPARLDFERRVSGPTPDSDPFAADLTDLAFVCAPSYPLLRKAGSPVALLPIAPVFADPRADGRPVYFSDVIVRSGHPARRFEELRGGVWAYNDRQSRSGWQNMLARLLEMGHAGDPGSFFRELLHAGSHLRSVELVEAGDADAAAIDSNTLWLKRREDPSLGARLRVIESWGPSPIQPLLVRETIPPPVRARIVEALLTLDAVPGLPERLGVFGLQRFVLVEEADYAAVRPAATISMVI